MTESDFAIIEEALGVAVPRSYRRVMSAYPFHDDRPSDAYIPDNTQYVCSLNQQIRDDRVYGDLWRSTHLAIGTNWDGDAFLLDASMSNSPVFRFSQKDQAIREVAASLDQWVARLRSWYVEFSSVDAAAIYQELVTAISNAGFFTTTPEPMDGWHRISVMSQRNDGNSFWVAVINNSWFVGTWGGNVYHVPESPVEFCVACLDRGFDDNGSDFTGAIRSQFCLKSVAEDELESLVDGGKPMR